MYFLTLKWGNSMRFVSRRDHPTWQTGLASVELNKRTRAPYVAGVSTKEYYFFEAISTDVWKCMESGLPSTAMVFPRRRGSSESLPSSRSCSHLCALCFPTKVSVRSVRRDGASHSLGCCWSDRGGGGKMPLNQLTPPESVG